MSPEPIPKHFKRNPIRAALLGGVVALSPVLVAPALAGSAVNPCASRSASRAGGATVVARACNPCAAKRACNPCAAKGCNPCAAKRGCNPCAAKRGCNPCNPCGAKGCNPCGGAKIAASAFKRPCGASVPVSTSAATIAEGKRLWNSATLSTNGLSCQTCHQGYGNLNATFAKPYPHWVAMADQRAGVKEVTADEMVQFCMLVPMQAKTLGWSSQELAALTAYTVALQQGFNPCKASKASCNPCAAKRACNPCNPCAAKRACNPCAAKRCNPCAAKRACNPCNPCAAKKKW